MAKQVKKAAKKKVVKRVKKGVTEAQIKSKLRAAAKALNHPLLRPRDQKTKTATAKALMGDGGAQGDIVLFTPFCITEKRPLGPATQDSDDAQAVADHHQSQTGDNVKVIASN